MDNEQLYQTIGDIEWHDRAACRDYDVSRDDPFFPPKGGSSARAKAICAGCKVRGTCLEWAMKNNVEFGIYGGLTGRERKVTRPRTKLPNGSAEAEEERDDAA